MGHAAFEQSAGGFGGGGFGGGGFGGGGFADIFDQMFSEFSGGAGVGRQRNSSGNDLRYDMTVSLENAFIGLQEDISITVPASCYSCSGERRRNKQHELRKKRRKSENKKQKKKKKHRKVERK